MKITVRMLEHFFACKSAKDSLHDILPITVYKNVELNNSAAIKLINLYTLETDFEGFYRSLIEDLMWLLRRLSNYATLFSKQHHNIPVIYELADSVSTRTHDLDPLVISQILSWIADTNYRICSV